MTAMVTGNLDRAAASFWVLQPVKGRQTAGIPLVPGEALTLGRGCFGIRDARVSRQHIRIELDPQLQYAMLTLCGKNPGAVALHAGAEYVPLHADQPVLVGPGARLALLPLPQAPDLEYVVECRARDVDPVAADLDRHPLTTPEQRKRRRADAVAPDTIDLVHIDDTRSRNSGDPSRRCRRRRRGISSRCDDAPVNVPDPLPMQVQVSPRVIEVEDPPPEPVQVLQQGSPHVIEVEDPPPELVQALQQGSPRVMEVEDPPPELVQALQQGIPRVKEVEDPPPELVRALLEDLDAEADTKQQAPTMTCEGVSCDRTSDLTSMVCCEAQGHLLCPPCVCIAVAVAIRMERCDNVICTVRGCSSYLVEEDMLRVLPPEDRNAFVLARRDARIKAAPLADPTLRDGPPRLVPLTAPPANLEPRDESEQLYHRALGLFQQCRDAGRGAATLLRVTSISLVINPGLEARYIAARTEIADAKQAEPVEKIFTHGTASANVQSIVREGFRVGGVDTPIAHGSAYGRGVYLAFQPDVSVGYAGHGRKRGMFIVKALVEDTGVGGSAKVHAGIVVVEDAAHVLPIYFVEFTNAR